MNDSKYMTQIHRLIEGFNADFAPEKARSYCKELKALITLEGLSEAVSAIFADGEIFVKFNGVPTIPQILKHCPKHLTYKYIVDSVSGNSTNEGMLRAENLIRFINEHHLLGVDFMAKSFESKCKHPISRAFINQKFGSPEKFFIYIKRPESQEKQRQWKMEKSYIDYFCGVKVGDFYKSNGMIEGSIREGMKPIFLDYNKEVPRIEYRENAVDFSEQEEIERQEAYKRLFSLKNSLAFNR